MADSLMRPVVRPVRLGGLAPVEVAGRLRHLPGLVFFDTAGHVPTGGGRPVSVIAARPARVLGGSLLAETERARLRAALAAGPQMAGDHGFPLGGLCGWVAYEGDFVFGDYREMLVHCHDDGTWWEVGRLSECLLAEPPAGDRPALGRFVAQSRREDFIAGVQRIKDWIAAGDIYQVNLSQAYQATVTGGSLFGLYEALREASPAPMAAWLSLAGWEVLSSSPEAFLKVSGRRLETRPIKGTRPRFADADEDRRSAFELQTSAKEIAELVMITDLLRNDLGQVCEFGSVAVAGMLQLESLAQVHHLVSTVTGTLRPGVDAVTALAACFPGGSITGAPKLRAMEIIRELEPSPRGIYCGALGWLGFNGQSSLNIAIRTLIRRGGRLTYQVGAGIVADSDPAQEYAETLHKAAGLRLAIARWQRG
ncbi:MAG: aminodeoxychorismate synthase component I [Verrucomicrobia bacterium]|nr:aminodeoxychorismate synthase component I [Verrucomicrobiota bacterium]